MSENGEKEKINDKEIDSKEKAELRRANPLVMKIIVIGGLFLMVILVTMHFWAKPTTGTEAQKKSAN